MEIEEDLGEGVEPEETVEQRLPGRYDPVWSQHIPCWAGLYPNLPVT